MNNLSGGYIMVDLSSPNKVKQLEKAAALNKPLLVYYQDGTTEWGKVTVTYETVDDVEVPTYHITTANGFVTVEADGDTAARPLIVEGDITKVGTYDINYLYNKWSLSGTHLMLVMCISNTSGDEIYIPNDTKIFSLTLPEYIYNKIYAISSDLVMQKRFTDFTDNRNFTMQLKKDGNNELGLYVVKNSQVGNTYTYRMQFDLLIDNE